MAAKQAEQSLLELWNWAGRVELGCCFVEQPFLHSRLLVPMIWSDGETFLLDQRDQNNRAVGEEHRGPPWPTVALSTWTNGEFVSTHTVFMLDQVTMVGTVAGWYTCRSFSFIYIFSGAFRLVFETRRGCGCRSVGDVAGWFRAAGPVWNQDQIGGLFLQHGLTAGGH